jgi:hypothetical protein
MSTDRTSLEALFQTFPGQLANLSGVHLGRRDIKNLFHLKSWGSSPDVILIDYVPEGRIVVMFQTGYRGLKTEYRQLDPDEIWDVVKRIDENWILLNASDSYAFHKELADQDKIPGRVVDQIRGLLGLASKN